MDNHIAVRHGVSRIACAECDFTAPTRKRLKSHVDKVHLGILHKCGLCDYRTAEKANIGLHKKVGVVKDFYFKIKIMIMIWRIFCAQVMHSVEDGVYYSCKNCDYKADQKADLKQHVWACLLYTSPSPRD